MSEHAFLAPSSAHIWGPGGCAYYPTMAAKYPQTEDTLEAREGTAAHHYVTETILERDCPVGSLAPNGHPVTEEMVDCGQALIWDVQSWGVRNLTLLVEHRLRMPSIHPTANWGTVDIGHVDMEARRIRQRDYKFGHLYVDAYENWQCVDYVVGIADANGITLDASWTIDIGIHQPRSYHKDGPYKPWVTTGDKIVELAAKLSEAAHAATQPEPEMRTGEYCLFCEGNHACPAYRKVVGRGMDVAMRGVPDELGPEALGLMRSHIRQALQRLEGLDKGLDALMDSQLRKGKSIPGWELQPTEGKLTWNAPAAEIVILGDLLGVDLRKDDVITPTQAIGKAKKEKIEIDEAVISAYAGRKTTLKVAPTDDKSAAKAFS